MRWIRFSHPSADRIGYGILEGDRVRPVAGDPFAGHTRAGHTIPFAEVTLEVPVVPPTFYCVGLNYEAHIRDVARKKGIAPDLPKQPDVGYRANNALTAHGRPVVIPADATKIQYEGELVVVIGRRARNLTEAEALNCVFGYTIGNDVSERTWQASDRTLWRAKNTDTFKPMGPGIETDVNLEALETVVRVNGVEDTRFRTNDMIFGVARFISTMSRYMTLMPGDVLWMGTDGHSPDLKPGDTVDIEITGIGVLSNPFVAATAS
jgi:2-keto-4-pentenoate hydratase/2-oxohepta-3-ene-1,7-dioic acid hydratase in catechol pathway